MCYQTIRPLLIGLFIFMLSSCAPTPQINDQLLNLKLQMEDLRKGRKDVELKVEELNDKIFLIGKKADTNKKSIEELRSVALLATPPDKLEVIKVSPPVQKGDTTLSFKGRIPGSLSVTEPTNRTKEGLTKGDVGESKPEDIYREAYLLFEEGRSDNAFEVFSDFLKRFPEHPLADNAQYWIGEIYYSQREFFRALREFKKVADDYPEGNKTPDAILKIALSYSELGDREAYIANLERLLDIYPASEAALKAMDRLNDIQYGE